jgi:REP element-mobilizing transposase RayT
MPDHIHGIIVIPNSIQPTAGALPRGRPMSSGYRIPNDLSNTVGRFKSLTTHKYTQGVQESNWVPYAKHLWQRNFHEWIIRDEESYQRICRYIANNPMEWWLEHYGSF